MKLRVKTATTIAENDPKIGMNRRTLILKEPASETETSVKLERKENTENMLGTWLSDNTTLSVDGEPLRGADRTILIAKANSVSKTIALKPDPSNSISSSARFRKKLNISTRSVKIQRNAQLRISASISTKSQRKGVFTPETRKIMEMIYRMGKSRQPAIKDICQLITSLGIKQIQQWFADRRHRGKKKGELEPTEECPLPLDGLIKKRTKRHKGCYSDFQREILNTTYKATVLDNNDVVVFLSDLLGLKVPQIKQWRADRRYRERTSSGIKLKSRGRKKTSLLKRTRVKSVDDPVRIVNAEMAHPTSLTCPGKIVHPFDQSRISPPATTTNDGLDKDFLCCGCALQKPESTIFTCCSCCKRFHQICLGHIFRHTEIPDHRKPWQCPRCSPANFPNATLPMQTHVSNGRGLYYYKGQPIDAEDRNTGSYTKATVFIVGRDSILLHFNNWSNIYNQWIPSNNPKIKPAIVSPRPSFEEVATSPDTIRMLHPYQRVILRSALSIGKLDATNTLTHTQMAIYCGISELDVKNFIRNVNNM